jgi:hypothetical protein
MLENAERAHTFLEMQTSAYFVAQAFFRKDGDQRNVDDDTHCQYYGRPRNGVGLAHKSADEQFQSHAEQGDFYKEIERS